MRSEAIFVAIALAACGGVDAPTLGAPPLALVHGHVDLATLPPHGTLLAALVWLDSLEADTFCLAHAAEPDFAGACPDPYWVRASRVSETAPVRADGTFDIDIASLPGGGSFVGGAAGQVGIGSVIVVSDDDGDGLPEPFAVETREGLLPPVDRVLAASFASSRLPSDRIVLRAGAFEDTGTFYPAPACTEPPTGFSLERAPPWAGPGTCAVSGLSETLETKALSDDLRPAFSCPGRGSYSMRAPDYAPGPESKLVCLSHDALAVFDPHALCPGLAVYRLVGCWGPGFAGPADAACAGTIDYDRRANPPEWWPC